MSLEESIQQPTFRNENLKSMVNILYTQSWLEERIKKFLQQENITMQQYNILRILRGAKKPLSTMQIRERMLDRMSDTSRVVDRMILKALVEKKLNKKDKRLVDVTITESGLKLLGKLDEKNKDLDDIMSNLSEAEMKLLNHLLDKLREG
ncbi:MAG TPA: MarR family transcriptional regulator [Panacibacter sp.]|nr:MarR family transcriptional regulator [Panacibacter sp.]HNP46637.1 MarR family transcriptional regulator [Panacibacter sp.]